MATVNVEIHIHNFEDPDTRSGQRDLMIIQQRQASGMMPDKKEPLHDLLQKHSDELGYLQMIGGLVSILLGIVLAITFDIGQSLFTLFRVSQLTGAFFFFAGLVCDQLYKYPALLTVCLTVNCGCIILAVIAACLISVDLVNWNLDRSVLLKIEVGELCLLGFGVFLSAVLCFWFSEEKRAKSK